MKRVAIRNFLIVAGIAGLVLVSEKGFTLVAVSAGQVITAIFVAAMAGVAWSYFRQNRLAWLVLKRWQRGVIVVAGAGMAFLIVAGFELFADRLTPLGVLALIAALGLVIVWIVYESRRFR